MSKIEGNLLTTLDKDIAHIKETLDLICKSLNIQPEKAKVTDIKSLAQKLIKKKERE